MADKPTLSLVRNVIIIGGGCAGLTAGIYCGRAELNPIIFAGGYEDKGGLLVKTSIVENYPGFSDGINGFDLMNEMEKQAIKYGAEIIDLEVIEVNFVTENKLFVLIDSENNSYAAKSIIICTGSKPNKLGLELENKFWSNGVSSCAVCDGALYKGKNIIVVGGGDTAMEEALFLTKFSNVLLIHRRKDFRASKIMIDRVMKHPKIKIMFNTIITKLIGKDYLQKIICLNIETGLEIILPVDGLFYGLGLTPNTTLFTNQIDQDSDGYIICHTNSNYKTMTSIEGVFVAGDCTDRRYKQAITAASDGCKGALDAINYLDGISTIKSINE